MGLHSSGQNILLPLGILISALLIYQSGNKEIFFFVGEVKLRVTGVTLKSEKPLIWTV